MEDNNWSDSDTLSHMREVVELKEDRRLRTAGNRDNEVGERWFARLQDYLPTLVHQISSFTRVLMS